MVTQGRYIVLAVLVVVAASSLLCVSGRRRECRRHRFGGGGGNDDDFNPTPEEVKQCQLEHPCDSLENQKGESLALVCTLWGHEAHLFKSYSCVQHAICISRFKQVLSCNRDNCNGKPMTSEMKAQCMPIMGRRQLYKSLEYRNRIRPGDDYLDLDVD